MKTIKYFAEMNTAINFFATFPSFDRRNQEALPDAADCCPSFQSVTESKVIHACLSANPFPFRSNIFCCVFLFCGPRYSMITILRFTFVHAVVLYLTAMLKALWVMMVTSTLQVPLYICLLGSIVDG
jgi:hypothetical protein